MGRYLNNGRYVQLKTYVLWKQEKAYPRIALERRAYFLFMEGMVYEVSIVITIVMVLLFW